MKLIGCLTPRLNLLLRLHQLAVTITSAFSNHTTWHHWRLGLAWQTRRDTLTMQTVWHGAQHHCQMVGHYLLPEGMMQRSDFGASMVEPPCVMLRVLCRVTI